jgi:hypothetical protein
MIAPLIFVDAAKRALARAKPARKLIEPPQNRIPISRPFPGEFPEVGRECIERARRGQVVAKLALAFGDALASNAPLQLAQLGFATHVHPSPPRSSSAVVGTLHDPLAFVLRQGAQERDEAATNV